MVAGADSIDDMDVLRYGALPGLFGGVRAPSTLGSFLRAFTLENVLQLPKVPREFLAELSRRAPLLPGVDCLPSLTSTPRQKRVYAVHFADAQAWSIRSPLATDRAQAAESR